MGRALADVQEEHEKAKAALEEAHREELEAKGDATHKETRARTLSENQTYLEMYVTGNPALDDAKKRAEEATKEVESKIMQRRRSTEELANVSNKLKEIEKTLTGTSTDAGAPEAL